MAGNSKRQGAIRKQKKGAQVGSGGQNKRGLQGQGPDAAGRGAQGAPGSTRAAASADRRAQGRKGKPETGPELLVGRNPVAEALRAKIPATALYVAVGIEADERVTEAIRLAGNRGLALLEISRGELDRRTGGILHQGIALQVPPYAYRDVAGSSCRSTGIDRRSATGGARRRHRPAQSRRDHPLGGGVRRATACCFRSDGQPASPRWRGGRPRALPRACRSRR